MLTEFAQEELARIKDDGYGGMVKTAVQELVNTFAKQGHSGYSAEMTTQAVEKLFRFKPLTSLTGADDEWTEVGTAVFQNKRNPAVFKEPEIDPRAYDINLPTPEGEVRAYIEFPYLP
jgi:hypothetical protein